MWVCYVTNTHATTGQHYNSESAAIALAVAYGYDVRNSEDHLVRIAEDAVGRISDNVVARRGAIIDSFPFLQHYFSWMSGGKFQQYLASSKAVTEEFITMPFNWTKDHMVRWAVPMVGTVLIEAAGLNGQNLRRPRPP